MITRQTVEGEISYARTANRHRSVRVVTLERVLKVCDDKTEALKLIHRICNKSLEDGDVGRRFIKDVREIASKAWTPLAPQSANAENLQTVEKPQESANTK